MIRSASLSALGTAREPPGWKSFWQSIKRSVVMVLYLYVSIVRVRILGSMSLLCFVEDFFRVAFLWLEVSWRCDKHCVLRWLLSPFSLVMQWNKELCER